MPKMKTDKGAKKRFSLTGTGKVRRRRAFKNHMLEKKGESRKRRLSQMANVSSTDVKTIKKLLGR